MAHTTLQTGAAVWELVTRQHGVVSRAQLLALGFTADAIKHRVRTGRLWPLWRGVYAVGRPGVTRHGSWMATLLACGSPAALCRGPALALWDIRPHVGDVHITVPARRCPRSRPGIVIHRRAAPIIDSLTERFGIPVTGPVQSIIDSAPDMSRGDLERAVNEADRLGLVAADALRGELVRHAGEAGVAIVRATLDVRTFALTRSELERIFLPIGRRAGLPKPRTEVHVNGFEVDFWWPELRLVVETDGLRYHRTPAQQARDRVRDQAHMAAGDYPLRFTHAQVRYEAAYVERVLRAVGARLRRGA